MVGVKLNETFCSRCLLLLWLEKRRRRRGRWWRARPRWRTGTRRGGSDGRRRSPAAEAAQRRIDSETSRSATSQTTSQGEFAPRFLPFDSTADVRSSNFRSDIVHLDVIGRPFCVNESKSSWKWGRNTWWPTPIVTSITWTPSPVWRAKNITRSSLHLSVSFFFLFRFFIFCFFLCASIQFAHTWLFN